VNRVDTTDMETLTAALTLRRARELAGVDPHDAARRLGVRPGQLRAYEAGQCAVPASVLSDAAAVYGAPEVTVVSGVDLPVPGDPRFIAVGTERIPVADAHHDNPALLQRYVAAVRRQRGLGPHGPVELRAADVAMLAGLLDLTDEDLERQLGEASGASTGSTRRAARSLVLSGLVILAADMAAPSGTAAPSSAPRSSGTSAGEGPERPHGTIGVAYVIARGGLHTVRTGLEASPAEGLRPEPEQLRPEADVPVEEAGTPAPAIEAVGRSPATDGRGRSANTPAGGERAMVRAVPEQRARRDAQRVARRETLAERQAELQAEQDARARRRAEEAMTRAEEQGRRRPGRRD
jgi:transcriptional regulator with XRE-family HTH domain